MSTTRSLGSKDAGLHFKNDDDVDVQAHTVVAGDQQIGDKVGVKVVVQASPPSEFAEHAFPSLALAMMLGPEGMRARFDLWEAAEALEDDVTEVVPDEPDPRRWARTWGGRCGKKPDATGTQRAIVALADRGDCSSSAHAQ